jgi:DNA-directed RNA polymerase specialized sigma24 family protein
MAESRFAFRGSADVEKRNQFMSDESDVGDDADSRPEGSVARAIAAYQNGEAAELGELIKAYFDRLLRKARAKLGSFPHTDHEGLVQSTLRSFLRGAKNGQYPDMKSRDELSRMLGTIMRCKVAHHVRDETAAIAGGGRVRNEPEGGLEAADNASDPLEEAIAREWLEHMGERGQLDAAQLVLEGYRYFEIAERLGMTESRARRTITMIHKQTRIFFGVEKD